MNYLLLIYEDEKALHSRDEETREQVFGEYQQFTQSVRDGGHFVAADALEGCVVDEAGVYRKPGTIGMFDGTNLDDLSLARWDV